MTEWVNFDTIKKNYGWHTMVEDDKKSLIEEKRSLQKYLLGL